MKHWFHKLLPAPLLSLALLGMWLLLNRSLSAGHVLLGGLLALIGSFGLVHLKSFFQRIHAPTLVATMGMWCITLATIVYFSVQGGQIYLHGLLITFFIALTTPITTIFLMRAALFRERMTGRGTVPPTVSTPPNSGTQ